MSYPRLALFLGLEAKDLLHSRPFSEWEVTRSVERDPKVEVRYVFDGHGVELTCDESERIRSIFVHRGDGEALAGIPFSLSRVEVLARHGSPSSSGGPVQIPVLGDSGAWDRFTLAAAVLHVQYRLDRDEIDMVTFMRPDVVPQ